MAALGLPVSPRPRSILAGGASIDKGKIETLEKEGFEKFKQNWLLIYDNWSLPALDREKAAQFLLPKLIESDSFDSFGRVYIITGNLVCEFSITGIVQHQTNELWK